MALLLTTADWEANFQQNLPVRDGSSTAILTPEMTTPLSSFFSALIFQANFLPIQSRLTERVVTIDRFGDLHYRQAVPHFVDCG